MKTTMLNETDLIFPDWPAPGNVKAVQTTRNGGFSKGAYASFNLGSHVGDDPLIVAANRQLLSPIVPTEPVWLSQVHGTQVINAATANCAPTADAAFAASHNTVCAVMTADCLPILLCDQSGTVVAAVHAGWRGLLNGVIEASVQTMQKLPGELMAWLGPAIGPTAFEVGDEVRDAFLAHGQATQKAFVRHGESKWLADIYQLARMRLQKSGIESICGGNLCTYSDANSFYSYRRDGITGRMATLVWLTEK